MLHKDGLSDLGTEVRSEPEKQRLTRQAHAQERKACRQPSERHRSSRSARQTAGEILLLCTTATITPRAKEHLSQLLAGAVDWEHLLNLAEFHSVMPLVAHNLMANGFATQVPEPYSGRLRQINYSALYRNVNLSAELLRIVSVFNKRGIAAIALKGTVLAELLYGNPGLRTVADIDILVKPEQIAMAGSLLEEMGYEQSAQSTWHHPFHRAPYFKRGGFPLFIELHWDLDDPKLVAVPEGEIWRRALTLPLEGVPIMVLSPEDSLLFLADQFSKELTHLKLLGDIAETLKKYEDVLDWDYILESAHSWQIEIAMYYSLRRAKDLLGAPVPPSSLRVLQPGKWRWLALNWLAGQEIFLSPMWSEKLREETSALARGLMMKHVHQMVAILSRYRGASARAGWLRTAIWAGLVFGAALGRTMASAISRQLWRMSQSASAGRVGR